jgi:hypothetical protein
VFPSVFRSIVFHLLPRPKWLRRPARWLCNRLQSSRGQPSYPRAGLLKLGEPSPNTPLNLQRGEIVRVKSYHQILATINSKNLHRGLSFDVEMIPYCGRAFRVRARVTKFIDEQTGVMKVLRTPAVILEGAICSGHHSSSWWLCPRAIFPWWRGVWLERLVESGEKTNPLDRAA